MITIDPYLYGKMSQKYKITGETVNAYADAADFNTENLYETSIILCNTDGANALKYKIFVSMNHENNFHEAEHTSETTLATGEDIWVIYKLVGRIRIAVCSAVADTPADYEVQAKGISL